VRFWLKQKLSCTLDKTTGEAVIAFKGNTWRIPLKRSKHRFLFAVPGLNNKNLLVIRRHIIRTKEWVHLHFALDEYRFRKGFAGQRGWSYATFHREKKTHNTVP
jgi:hypothetical protein